MSEIEELENLSGTQTTYEKCSSCGGNLIFDPSTQQLKCENCGTVFDFEKDGNVKELDILSALEKTEKWEDATVFKCENCGATVVLNANETAKRCPYCLTAHVQKVEQDAGIKPNAVYPFTIDKETAVENATKWAKKRMLAPRSFKKSLKVDNVSGVYEPSFTYDSSTFSTYNGRIGTRHTRTVGSGKNRRTETYIVWRNISGTHSEFFDDVTVNAGSSMDQKMLDKILPYNVQSIKNYESKFLTGFLAKRNEKNVKEGWDDAKKAIDSRIKSHILSKYHYDVVDYLNVRTNHSNVTYKYVLLPIYHLSFLFKKKKYGVHINGETGKVAGKTPKSPVRIGLIVLIVLAIAVLIGYLVYKNQIA